MIPTNRLVVLLVISGLAIGMSGVLELLIPLGIALAALTFMAAVADGIALYRLETPEIVRNVDEKLSVGAENTIKLRITNRSRNPIYATVRDEYPEDFSAADNVQELDLPSRSRSELTYKITPPHRGDYAFGDIYLRLRGPMGLFIRQIRCPLSQKVKVYPNLLDLRRYDISLQKDRLMQPGLRSVRVYGRGTDFESLREYLPDDDFRSIDWKASARADKLISRNYQLERSQNVMIVLDCGRVMGPVIEGLSRLDWGINAGMMLAHVATARGDKVGLMAFADQVLTFSTPKSGKDQALNLLRMTYNLHSTGGDSDYYRAFPFFSRKCSRRSLVVIFAELTDPEASRPLISQIALLARKHLCVVVTMADPGVTNAADAEPETVQDVFRASVAKQVIKSRQLAAAEVVRSGATVLDVLPDQFSPAVVDEYLRIKGSGRL